MNDKLVRWLSFVPVVVLLFACSSAGLSEDDVSGGDEELEQVAVPILSPAAGELAAVPQEISFTSDTSGATFYYTTDGNDPDTASTSASSYTVTEPITLKVMATKSGMEESEIVTAEYTVFQAPSSNADLADVSFTAGILNPGFDPAITNYEVYIPASANPVSLTPYAAGPGTTITVGGNEVSGGEASESMQLSDSESVLVRVTAEDAVTEKTYTFNVNLLDHDAWMLRQVPGSKNSNWWPAIASSGDGMTLAAGGLDDWLYLSDDGGSAWGAIKGLGEHDWSSIMMSDNGNRIFATYDQYIVASTDGGNTWSDPIDVGIGNLSGVVCSADGAVLYTMDKTGNSKYLYSSSDYGASWNQVSAAGEFPWRYVACSADGSTVIASCGYSQGVPRISYDAGSTWTDVSGLPAYNSYYSLTMTNNGTKLACTSGGSYGGSIIQISTDGGVTWNSVSSYNANEITYSGDGTLLMGSYYTSTTNDIILSSDDGTHWTEYTDREKKAGIVTMSNDGQRVFISPYNTHGYTELSTDSGASWAKCTTLGRRRWRDIDMSTNGQYQAALFYGGNADDGSVFLSSDYGASWQEQAALAGRPWQDIAIDDSGTVIAVSNENTTMMTTTQDHGASWDELAAGGSGNGWSSIAMNSTGDTMVATETDTYGYIVYSTDAGSTWNQAASADRSPYWYDSAVSDDGEVMAAVGSSNFWLSTDHGQNWEEMDLTHLTPPYTSWESVSISGDGTAIAVLDVMDSVIYYSTDTGTTWVELEFAGPDEYPSDVVLSYDGTGIAVAAGSDRTTSTDPHEISEPGHIYVSMNGGESFEQHDTDGTHLWASIAASANFEVLTALIMDEESGVYNCR